VTSLLSAAPERRAPGDIDLRSDFVSPPSEAMLQAMADAALAPTAFGFREGDAIRALEGEAARLLGKEDALWFPTCSMANLAAILLQTTTGGALVAPHDSHVATTERAGVEAIARRTLVAPPPAGEGQIDPNGLAELLAANPAVGVVVLEDTHNRSGGVPLPPGRAREIAEVCRARGQRLHLDGARLFNSAVAQGVAPADLAAPADSVAISLNKGLGAPNGAVLAGSRMLIEGADTVRQQLGGGMRPLAILAAAGVMALRRWPELEADHLLAARLGAELADLGGCAVDPVRTNIVLARLPLIGADTVEFVHSLARRGVLAMAFGVGCVRLCVNGGVAGDAVPAVVAAFREAIEEMGRPPREAVRLSDGSLAR